MTANPIGINCTSLCPDCNASRRLVEVAPGLTVLQVLHDDTCPWLSERKPDGRPRT